jgi:hypothetical protein
MYYQKICKNQKTIILLNSLYKYMTGKRSIFLIMSPTLIVGWEKY